jgi:hypothetical protein
MKTQEFKVGDKVRIARKGKCSFWVSTMNSYIGKLGEITDIGPNFFGVRTAQDIIIQLPGYAYPANALQHIEQLTRKELINIINKTPQRCMITVEFIKKDGSLRKLTGIRGPTHYLKGSPGENKPTVNTDKHFLFCEMRKGYRAVAKDRLMSVSVDGVYYFTEEPIGE